MADNWFRHDQGARMDSKMRYIVQRHTVAGTGLFWMLVEMMRDEFGKSGKHGIELGKIEMSVLSGDSGLSQDKIDEMLSDFVECGLFVIEDGRYISNRLRHEML